MARKSHISICYFCIVIAITILINGVATAEERTDQNFPTFQLDTHFGFSTYKSEMVASNDTGTMFGYSLGFHAGSQRNIGIFIKNDTSNIKFELNESNIQTTWQDVFIRYRLSGFYLGIALSSAAIIASKESAELIDVVGNGYGGNFGMMFPIKKLGGWHLDVVSTSLSEARELDKTEVSVGPKTEIDLGATFKITKKIVDFMVGYKQRTTAIKISESYVETFTTTYLGFKFKWTF